MAMKCAFCDAQLRSTAKICVKCGNLVTDKPPVAASSNSTSADSTEHVSIPPTTTEAPVFDQSPAELTSPALTSSSQQVRNTVPVKSSPMWALTKSQPIKKIAIGVLVVVFVVVLLVAMFHLFASSSSDRDAGKASSGGGSSATPVVVVDGQYNPNAVEPAQLCHDINDCLLTALRSAADEDVDAVRQVAVSIDSFEKPTPGNKPLSRKLNSQGLQAFNQGEYLTAIEVFENAYQENPKDVEIASNLGLSLVRAGQFNEAIEILKQALILDPRRTSTWTPIAEAYAMMGRPVAALSAMWIGYQWSNDRQKSINFYMDKADSSQEQNQEIYDLYANMLEWTQGNKPVIFLSRSLNDL
jgi:hypothetical protein